MTLNEYREVQGTRQVQKFQKFVINTHKEYSMANVDIMEVKRVRYRKGVRKEII